MSTTVIWAIDPFETEIHPDPAELQALFQWMTQAGSSVQPLYVLPLNSTEQLEPDLCRISERIASAERVMQSYLAELGVTSALPPLVLTAPQNRRAEVQKLLGFVEKQNAPMIIIASRGHSGLRRMTEGSFAESLLLESRKPVFFLSNQNTATDSARTFQKILFPTDFSKRSQAAFLELLPQAKLLGAKIVLFHAIAVPTAVFAPAGLYGAADTGIPEGYFDAMMSSAREESKRWAQEAKATGVSVQVVIKDEGVSTKIAPSILNSARQEQVNLIAMASLSGPFTSFVAGSVARDVIRSLEYPVYVWGPRASDNTADQVTGLSEPLSR